MKPSKSIQLAIAISLVAFLASSPCSAQSFRWSVGTSGGYSRQARWSTQGNIPVGDLFKSDKLRFQESVLKGDTERAKRWVKADFVNEPIRGNAPIYYAAAQGNGAMIRLLANNGASVRARFQGRSLAYVAASHGHSDTARLCASLGGGRPEDFSPRQASYAANSARQRKEDRETRAASTKIANDMLESFFGPSPTGGSRSGETPLMRAQRDVDESMENDMKSLARPFVRQFMSENNR